MNDFKKVQRILECGGVIIYPTETLYGLGCDPFQKEAVGKVFKLKKRELYQTPLVLIPDWVWLKKLTKNIDPLSARLIDHFWPGPLTIVFEASRDVPDWIVRDDETIALRMSSHPWVKEFMAHFGKPLISTSANISGEPPLGDLGEVQKVFQGNVDFYVDGGTLPVNRSSTIVTMNDGQLKILRKGDIGIQKLKEVLHGSS